MIAKNKPKHSILITPVSEVEGLLLDNLSTTLGNVFSVNCQVTSTIEIPNEAYNYERNQFHSTVIISRLKNHHTPNSHKILGVTEHDLFVPEVNFVFGQADMNGPGAVISLHRLRQQFYGKESNDKIFFERTIKESIHELGHAWGVKHCKNKKCIMYFSSTIKDTDKKLAKFCKKCENIFDNNINE